MLETATDVSDRVEPRVARDLALANWDARLHDRLARYQSRVSHPAARGGPWWHCDAVTSVSAGKHPILCAGSGRCWPGTQERCEALREGGLSEDDERRAQSDVDELTTQHTAKLDELAKEKEAELLEI